VPRHPVKTSLLTPPRGHHRYQQSLRCMRMDRAHARPRERHTPLTRAFPQIHTLGCPPHPHPADTPTHQQHTSLSNTLQHHASFPHAARQEHAQPDGPHPQYSHHLFGDRHGAAARPPPRPGPAARYSRRPQRRGRGTPLCLSLAAATDAGRGRPVTTATAVGKTAAATATTTVSPRAAQLQPPPRATSLPLLRLVA